MEGEKVFDKAFYGSVRQELTGGILPYWERYARDNATGGFWSVIDNGNTQSDRDGGRSIVMASRYLWAYSAAARLLKDIKYLEMADYAFNAINRDYYDKEYGGFFWSVNKDGSPCVEKKQIYGEAFAIYGISEYAAAVAELLSSHAETQARCDIIMGRALEVFTMLEHYARDTSPNSQVLDNTQLKAGSNGNTGYSTISQEKCSGLDGYIEAASRDWTPTADLKLSEKDIDCAKSMNTNLHVLEAYTALHRNLPAVHPGENALRALVGKALRDLTRTMMKHIVMQDGHLGVYFNMDWGRIGNEVSYGHDIEASWLLWEAAEESKDEALIAEARPVVLHIADAALREGYDEDTGGFDNKMIDGKRDTSRVWWNQAEAVNGFYNAWEITGRGEFADACKKVWQWIIDKQRDRQHGEWYQEVSKEGIPNMALPKGGNWKTAYHNARCCMEVLRRGEIKGMLL